MSWKTAAEGRKKPWHACTRELADVAAGRTKADLLIRNGRWVNVHTGEIIAGTDVAVKSARIAFISSDAGRAVGPDTCVFDAAGRFLLPGLCDAHMHVESGMLTVTEFCRAVMPHGTTSMFVDPHEIGNVLGLPGVRMMLDEALEMPVGVHVQVPSCVPSAPGFEDSGAEFGPDEIAEAMAWPGIAGLGEMMSFPALAAGNQAAHDIVAATMRTAKVVGGHFPAEANTPQFHAYFASGTADDHEVTSMGGAIERARRGVRTMLRLGSAWHDVAETVRAITEEKLDARQFLLCTDDSHAGTLVEEGHMDRVVRHAVSRGLPPVMAIQMATLNTAEHFGMAREIGSIAPGRIADIIVSSDLVNLQAEAVFVAGELSAENGRLLLEAPKRAIPAFALDTVNIGRSLDADDFAIRVDGACSQVTANVIGVIENQAPTRALQCTLAVAGGKLQWDMEQDVCGVAVVERHRGTGKVSAGLVSGFGFDCECAVASTVAHDCHHLLVVGTSSSDMAAAANCLAGIGGGVAVFQNGERTALVELPVAGLMSMECAETVAEKASRMTEAMVSCGCRLRNAFMQLSLLALAVIPEMRITNRGLVDVRNFEFVELLTNQKI